MPSIGDTFGRLTVEAVHSKRAGGKNWLCLCACGNRKVVFNGSLTSGRTRSCGCLLSEASRSRATSHGDYGSAEYRIWCGMKKRCSNPMDSRYAEYGGRGIAVCDRWATYENFLLDMGRRPSSKHSIERINNNGNYEPSNCKWATIQEQSLNKRNARMIEIDGIVKNLATWAKLSGQRASLIWQRINNGMDAKSAVFTPSKRIKREDHQNAPASMTSSE